MSSGSSLTATVNAAPTTPTTPTLSAVSQPGCGGTTGSFTITNYNSSYVYTISPSTGVSRSGSTITANWQLHRNSHIRSCTGIITDRNCQCCTNHHQPHQP
ncbi:MAG: hypothetical protein IPI18_18345 [Saprospiraceae bacterium]|nr:hypothetical protein [Saprospiraceae bacterium]